MSGVNFEDGGNGSTIDLSGVEEVKFEILPKGVYDVIVADAEGKESQSGNKMISLTLEVETGEFAKRKLFTHVVFSPKTLGQAKATIGLLGLGELLQGPFDPLDPEVAQKFLGKRARAKVDIDKYEGDDTNKVKRLLPAGGGTDGFGG